MKVKRVSYVEKNGIVKRLRKTVIEVVEPDAYVSYNYQWSDSLNKWLPIKGNSYFDGIDCIDVGVLHLKDNAGRYVELLTKYSGFEHMGTYEDNTDTHIEDEYLNSLLNSVDSVLMSSNRHLI